MEAAVALEGRERLVMGPRAGCSRRRTRSLRRADGYGGHRVAVAVAPASVFRCSHSRASTPSVSTASSAVDPSILGLARGKRPVGPGAWGVRAGALSSRTELFGRCPSCPERNVRSGVLPDRTVGSYRRPFSLRNTF